MAKRLYVDLDGTLAEFKAVDTLEVLMEKGYFYSLEPQPCVVDAVKRIVKEEPEIEVFVLSAYLSDSKYALEEKNWWLDRHLPEIDQEHRLFVKCGEDKKEFIKDKNGNIGEDDFLLDDYSVNLHSWEPPAKGIKLMNGINGNFGTWKSNSLSIEHSGVELEACLKDIILNNAHYHDVGPNQIEEIRVNGLKNGR